jgi:thiosulfate dehydrogenase [quinone] large subunit
VKGDLSAADSREMTSTTVRAKESGLKSSLAENFKLRTYLGYIALVRILLGYHFLGTGFDKFFGNFLNGRSLLNDLTRGGPKDPLAWHHAFIMGFVVPHVHFFSYLVTFGEIAIGISLLVGCLVRVSSSFGAFHNMNIWLAIGWGGPGSVIGLNRTFVLLHLIFVFSSAGRALGIDGFLHRKFPRTKLF